jgi:hypothetical protein
MKTSNRSLKRASKVHNKYECLWAKHHERILEGTSMSVNLRNVSACFTSSFKAFKNRGEVKEDELKGILKTLIPSSWVQKLAWWKKIEK